MKTYKIIMNTNIGETFEKRWIYTCPKAGPTGRLHRNLKIAIASLEDAVGEKLSKERKACFVQYELVPVGKNLINYTFKKNKWVKKVSKQK